jgi:hypothetical protein
MFASRHKKTIVVKDDDGVDRNIVIAKLSARSLELASDQRQIAVSRVSRQMGAEMLRAFRDQRLEEPKDPKEKRKSRLQSYDRETVLMQGIDSWDILGPDGKPLPKEKGIADFDEETAQYVFTEIMDLSVPVLTEEEINTLEKADSGRSISSSAETSLTTQMLAESGS